MERSEDTTFDTPAPSEPECDCLLKSLVQLLETAKQISSAIGRRRRRCWQKRHPFYNQRWTVVRALTTLERVDWQAGR